MSARPERLWLMLAVFAAYVQVGIGGGNAFAQASASRQDIQQKAISLRELKAHAESPQAGTLYGATWLRGFVFIKDGLGKDCILLTYVESGRPTLRLEDFAVAFRNVNESQQRPACTIDPRPNTLAELSQLGQQIMKARLSTVESLLTEWHRIARSPQDVSVFGISPDTRYANVIVEADYYLKSVCNGSEKIQGVRSLKDILTEDIKKEVQRTGRLSPVSLYNRFWFNPGKPSLYRSDGNGTVILGKCPVVLLTEREATTTQGKRTGAGKSHPLAKKFADGFTAQYKDVAKRKPIYRELESMYRYVAIADLLVQAAKELGAEEIVPDVMRGVRVPRYPSKPTVLGRSHVEKVSLTQGVLYLPSCGGVSVDLHVDLDDHRLAAPRGQVSQIVQSVLSARPSSKTVWWHFRSEPLLRLEN